MEIIPKKIIETQNGWKIKFLITLTPEEFSKFNSMIEEFKANLRYYKVSLEKNQLIIEREIKTMEPWEDETPDALIESLKIEIKGLFDRIFQK